MEPAGRKLLKDKRKIKIFLSHYHLDHTFGFYAAFEMFEKEEVEVFGLEDRHVLKELVSIGQFPVEYEKKHRNFSWIKAESGKDENEGFKYSTRVQKHRFEKSLGYRLEFENGKSIAYVTDADPSRESVNFVKGADLLLHEHETQNVPEYTKDSRLEDLISKGGHITTQGAALIAKEAGVKKLYLIHHNPPCTWAELEKDLKKAKRIFPESFLTQDLEEIEF